MTLVPLQTTAAPQPKEKKNQPAPAPAAATPTSAPTSSNTGSATSSATSLATSSATSGAADNTEFLTTGKFLAILFVLILIWVVAAVPFGMLGAGLAMPPLYDRPEDYPKNDPPPIFVQYLDMTEWDADDVTMNGAIWTALASLGIVVLVGYYMFHRFSALANFFIFQNNSASSTTPSVSTSNPGTTPVPTVPAPVPAPVTSSVS